MPFEAPSPPPPSHGGLPSTAPLTLTFRTVGNRSCTLSIHRGRTTFSSLVEAVGNELGLRVSTIKLLRGNIRLLSMQDIFFTAECVLEHRNEYSREPNGGGGRQNAILVVGAKALASSSPPTQGDLASGADDENAATKTQLRFPHVPNGLRELEQIVTSTKPRPAISPSMNGSANDASNRQLGAMFEELSCHPTMRHISEMIARAPTSEAVEEVLRNVLLQVGEVVPEFLKWIQSNARVFLSALNRSPNPFIIMAWDVLNELRQMMENMGIPVAASGTRTVVDMNNGEAVYVFNENGEEECLDDEGIERGDGAATGEQQTVMIVRQNSDGDDGTDPFKSLDGGDAHRASPSSIKDVTAEEELAMLEASLGDVEDVFLEASIHRELALSYQSLHQSVTGGRGDAGQEQYFESKTSMWFRKAVAAVVHAVQHVPMPGGASAKCNSGEDEDDDNSNIWTMQALCALAPSCFVGAQTWFKGRDAMSSLAACIAHLTFWDIVETFNQHMATAAERHHEDPFRGMPPPPVPTDDAASVVYSHPGTVRASVASVTSSSICGGGGGGRVDESVMSTVESLADPFQETMRLMRYTQEHNTTVVLYSLAGPGTMLVYVLRNGKEIRIAQAPVAHDGFKGAITFLEESLRRRRFGVNLNLLWTEHMSSMYATLVQPIEHWLPASPSEVTDVDAGQVCFIVSFSPVPLPFSAMLDANGVPAIAKWAVFQAHVPTDIFVAESSAFLTPTAGTTMVLTEGTPNWMTRQLARSLGATPMTGPSRPGDVATILHVDNMNHFPISALPLCDFFVCERFVDGMRYNIHRAALVRSLKIHADDEGFAYEFGRTLYLTLAEGKTICRAVRAAVMATISVHPLEPWVWGSTTLFNYGGALSSLEHHAERQAKRAQRREVESQRLLRTNAAATPESRYSEYMGVNTVYNAMVASLLQQKPETQDDIEDCLITCLETFPVDYRSTRPSSTASRASQPSSSVAVGKMMPAPPERPPGVKPARSGQNSTPSSQQAP